MWCILEMVRLLLIIKNQEFIAEFTSSFNNCPISMILNRALFPI